MKADEEDIRAGKPLIRHRPILDIAAMVVCGAIAVVSGGWLIWTVRHPTDEMNMPFCGTIGVIISIAGFVLLAILRQRLRRLEAISTRDYLQQRHQRRLRVYRPALYTICLMVVFVGVINILMAVGQLELALPASLAVGTAVCSLFFARQLRRKIMAYEGGLVLVEGKRLNVIRWNDIKTIWIDTGPVSLQLDEGIYGFTLQLQDGREVSTPPRSLRELSDLLKLNVAGFQVPQMHQAIERGERVEFGAVALSREGLFATGPSGIPIRVGWDELAIRAEGPAVVIGYASNGMTLTTLTVDFIANFNAFCNLIYDHKGVFLQPYIIFPGDRQRAQDAVNDVGMSMFINAVSDLWG